MASVLGALRTCGLILFIIIKFCSVIAVKDQPWIESFSVQNKSCDNRNCKYLLNVKGGEFLGHLPWRLTHLEAVKGEKCDLLYPNYEFREIETGVDKSIVELIVPEDSGKLFFCLRVPADENQHFGGNWIHQGVTNYLEARNDEIPVRNLAEKSFPANDEDLQQAVQNVITQHNFQNTQQEKQTNQDTQQQEQTNQNAQQQEQTNQDTQEQTNQDKVEDNQDKYSNLQLTENLVEDNSNWVDLSHDIDVNNKPGISRPTREEAMDILVMQNNVYIPLSDVSSFSDDINDEKNLFNVDDVALTGGNVQTSDENIVVNYERDNDSVLNSELDDLNYVKAPVKEDNIEVTDESTQISLVETKLNKPVNEIKNPDVNTHAIKKHKYPESIEVFELNINVPESEIKFENDQLSIDLDSKEIQQPIKENHVFDSVKVKLQEVQHNGDFVSNNQEKSLEFKQNSENQETPLRDAKIVENPSYTNIENLNTDESRNQEIELLREETLKNEQIHQQSAANEIKTRTKREIEPKHNKKNDYHENIDSTTHATNILSHPGVLKNGKDTEEAVPTIDDDRKPRSLDTAEIVLDGLRIDASDKEPNLDKPYPSIMSKTKVTLRLFGTGFTPNTAIVFTQEDPGLQKNKKCVFSVPGEWKVNKVEGKSAIFDIVTPPPTDKGDVFYICAKNIETQNVTDDIGSYIHLGTDDWQKFATHNKVLPLWAAICLIIFCLLLSALFSGLNLGLMSLDRTDLKIIANTGTDIEKRYAKAIQPVRDHGNYLLCTILLTNVAVNSTFTILLDDITSGLFAVIFSTLAIVLLGEITPQAICSRHGLMVGAKSIYVTKFMMVVTAPLAYPVSKLLDCLLGEELGNYYNRERLKELVKVTNDINDLDKDEVNIISGALELRKKTVLEVMTRIDDVFMLPVDSVLDFETMSEIIKSGFSRIPVFEGSRTNIITVLFIKDLAFVDPDDNTPLRTLCQFYQNPCNFVFEDVTLDVMFRQFKEGHKGHMAFVHRVNNEGEGDPFYETIGLVTLEDVIEELIQAEIIDETDVFTDNRSKRKRNRTNKLQDFAAFAERRDHAHRTRISPQLTLATFQFLSTTVDPFKPDNVSETVLRRLLRQDIIHHIKSKSKDKNDPVTLIYTQGKAVDYFVLVLEGRVEVTVGRENLVFEAGPFTYFGVQALTQNVGVAESPTPSAMGSLQNINMDAMLRHTFVPDYSVRAITEVYYMTVKRSLYLAAKRATLMEKTSSLSKAGPSEQFDSEVDKLLQSLDEDGSLCDDHRISSRQISPNLPVSASPVTRSSFTQPADSPARANIANNGDVLYSGKHDQSESEKLLPK